MGPGHKGKKHRITSGHLGGKFYNALNTVEEALAKIEDKTKKNPVEVLVKAIENAALREEIISYQMGSIIAREGVISSPQRRIDKALRFFAQGTYAKSFNTKKPASQALADEIVGAYEGKESHAIKEKERIEREALGAR
jgi:small subunit ribosomal protein S7